jgi:hypothetical protein
LLDRCTDVGESLASSPTLAVESDVLVAACSSLALRAPPLKSMRRHRHREAALERVLARDPGHPRALWVAAWDESLVALHTGRPLPEPQRLALARVVEAFRDWDADGDVPNWGYAEALAHLGAACLAAGDARRGRDLLEEALLVAPGYRLALELMVRLKASAYP